MIMIFDWTFSLYLYVTTTLFVKYYIDISICISMNQLNLKYGIKSRKIFLENSELESTKLKLETDLIKLQIEQTRADIAIKHHQMRERGIPVETTFVSM